MFDLSPEVIDKLLFLLVMGLAMYAYITQRLSVITIALVTMVLLMVFDLLTLDQALSGFSSPATISIGAMFILTTGLIKTGAVEPLTRHIARFASGSYPRLILAMAVVIPVCSAFMNNTPIVVMMVPVVMGLARGIGVPPSKLLMPLSFFAILGGTCTLIGTSTNLLIDDIYRVETGIHLDIFDFSLLGSIVLLIGGTFTVLTSKKLLPDRTSLSSILPPKKRASYVTEVVVNEGSPLIGKTAKDVFPSKGKLRFIQLIRESEIQMKASAGKEPLQMGDAIILEGEPAALNELLHSDDVTLGTVLEDNLRVPMRTFERYLFELVVLPDSPLVGNQISMLKLNKLYGIKLVAIQRGGRHHRQDMRGMRIKSGDMFLVQGDQQALTALKDTPDFLVIEEVEKSITKPAQAKWALGSMVAVVVLTAVTTIPLVVWALAGVVFLILIRVLGTDDCIAAVDFNVLFLLVGTIPLGHAFVSTGLTDDIAHFLLVVVGGDNPFLLVGSLYLVTNILTSLISNTAVAALMTPLAIGLAHQLGIDSKPLIMTVAYAASAAFATPIAYQTNIIVMGPGGYTFGDYMKIGVPLSLLICLVVTIAVPFIWPLQPLPSNNVETETARTHGDNFFDTDGDLQGLLQRAEKQGVSPAEEVGGGLTGADQEGLTGHADALSQELLLDVHGQGLQAVDLTAAAADGTGLVDLLHQVPLAPLSVDHRQPQLVERQDLRLERVVGKAPPQRLFDPFAPVRLARADEIDHHQTADAAGLNLSRGFGGGFQVGAQGA